MIYNIRRYYPAFYFEYGRLVWIATICLTLPLFVRGLNSYLYGKKAKYYYWYRDNFAGVNTMYVILSSVLPVVTQMSTLIFGARQQYNKKYNKKAYKTVRDSTTSEISRSALDSSDDDGNTSYSINTSRETRNYFDPPLEKF
jgi:hypothetical protein